MRDLINKLLLFLLLGIIGNNSNAKTPASAEQPSITIVYKLINTNLPDSILIGAYHNGRLTAPIKCRPANGKPGVYKFTLPRISTPQKFVISANKGSNNFVIGEYFYEPNDKIQMEITNIDKRDSAVFTGQGSAKYSLMDILGKKYDEYNRRLKSLKVPKIYDSLAYDSVFSSRYKLTSEYTNDKKTIIATFNSQISNDMRDMIFYDYSNYEYRLSFIMEDAYITAKNPRAKNQVRMFFNNNRSEMIMQPRQISSACPSYIACLFSYLKTNMIINEPKNNNTTTLYEFLKRHYKGDLRDRLLGEYIANKTLTMDLDYNQSVHDSLVMDASKIIISPYYQDLISREYKLKKGSEFHDADFIDISGKVFNTKNLKGKVFILDIWGAGCTGCALFHEMFEKDIYPGIKQNKDFVFLSIGVDKTRSLWLQGINGNKMSSPDYFNVSTDKDGIAHPFMKYYSVSAIPFILLVDKDHKIITTVQITNRKELKQQIDTLLDAD